MSDVSCFSPDYLICIPNGPRALRGDPPHHPQSLGIAPCHTQGPYGPNVGTTHGPTSPASSGSCATATERPEPALAALSRGRCGPRFRALGRARRAVARSRGLLSRARRILRNGAQGRLITCGADRHSTWPARLPSPRAPCGTSVRLGGAVWLAMWAGRAASQIICPQAPAFKDAEAVQSCLAPWVDHDLLDYGCPA